MPLDPAPKESLTRIASEIADQSGEAQVVLTDGQSLFGELVEDTTSEELELQHNTIAGEYDLHVPVSDIAGILQTAFIIDSVDEPWANNELLRADLHAQSHVIAEERGYEITLSPGTIFEDIDYKVDENVTFLRNDVSPSEVALNDIENRENIELDLPSYAEMAVALPYISHDSRFLKPLARHFGWNIDSINEGKRTTVESTEARAASISTSRGSHISEIDITSADFLPSGVIFDINSSIHIYCHWEFFDRRDVRKIWEKLNLGFNVGLLGSGGISGSISQPDYWKLYRRVVSKTSVEPSELSERDLGTVETYLIRLKSQNDVITAEMEGEIWHLYALSTNPISSFQECTSETSVACWFQKDAWILDENWVRTSPRTYKIFGEVIDSNAPIRYVNQDCMLKARAASYLPI